MESSGQPGSFCQLLYWLTCLSSIVLLSLKPVDCTFSAMLQAPVLAGPKFESAKPSSGRQAFSLKQAHISFPSKSPNRLIQNSMNELSLKQQQQQEVPSLSIEAGSQQVKPTIEILKPVQDFMTRFIAPAKAYSDLINRYHQWFTGHESIRKSSSHPIMEAMDVFKLEYAKVEQELLQEEVKKVKISTAIEHKIEETENLDTVLKILKRIIGNLESNLRLLEQDEGIAAEINLHPEAAIENEDAIKETMERIKRSFVNHAKSIVKAETHVMIKKAAFTGLAMLMEAKPDTGDFIDHLRPVVSILACASTPLATAYFQDIQFRASLAIVTHSLEAIMPFSKITEMLENSARKSIS